MTEYISKQAIFDAIKVPGKDRQVSLHGAVADFIVQVAAIPAEDVAPVRRGHWIKYDDWEMCSECGEGHEWTGFGAAYCDMCGAKMEGNNG